MSQERWAAAPWVVPWHYRSEADDLGWIIPRWMYVSLLGTSFGLGWSLGVLLNMPWLGLGFALFFAYAIPGELLEWNRQRKQKKMRNQLMETLRTLHTSYLVCNEWHQAVKISLPHLPVETREVFQKVLFREQLGVPFDEAMKEIKKPFPIPEVTYFLEVTQLLEQVGGPLRETLLEDVIEWVEESNKRAEELANEVAARQTEMRYLFFLFFIELAFFRIMGTVYFDGLFTSVLGQFLISSMFVVNSLCVVWVRQQIRNLEKS